MAVNSSHLSPGLFFNCSALPAGSSLLWSSATLFFTAFHEYHFAKQLLWGFSRWRSHLITYRYVNVWVFLALAGHNIFHMQGFQVSSKFEIQNTFELFFLLTYLLFSLLALIKQKWLSRFWQSGVREQRLVLQPSEIVGGPKNPRICIFLVKWSSVPLVVLCNCSALSLGLLLLWSSATMFFVI